MLLKLFCMATVLIIYSYSTYAENLYVTASGTNGSGTSWASPWVGFNNIRWGSGTGYVGPGDTLFIDGGTNGLTYSDQLTVGASGASGNFITIKVDTANSSHNGLVTINPNNAAGVYGILINGKSYVKIDGYNTRYTGNRGIEVKNTNANGILVWNSGAHHNTIRYIEQSNAYIEGIYFCNDGGYNLLEYSNFHGSQTQHGILFDTGTHNTASWCTAYDNYSSGLICYDQADYTLVQNCTFYHNGWTNHDCLTHGVYICGPSSYCTVINCYAYENGGAGIQVFASTGFDSTGNIVQYNSCFRNGNDTRYDWCGWGIVIAGYNYNVTCTGNWTYDNQRYGISLWDSSQGSLTWNLSYNNGHGVSNGCDADYDSYNNANCTIDYNTYRESTNSYPVIYWQGSGFLYTLPNCHYYQTDSGKDLNSSFILQ